MPYNPGVTNQAGQFIAQGMQQGKQNALALWGWLNQEAEETKKLQSTLGTIYPDRADQFKKMGKAELQGFAAGEGMKRLQEQQALETEHKKLLIEEAKRQAGNERAMSEAMKMAQPAPENQSEPMFPGSNWPPIRFQTQGAPSQRALINAMMQNPGSEQTRTGEWALREWFQHAGEGGEQGVIPWTLGTGDNLMSGGIETKTGKLFFDPQTEGRIADKKRKPVGATGTGPMGKGPVYSEDGRFYWDEHLRTWKPVSSKGGLGLFGPGGGSGGTDQNDPLGLFKQ